MTQLAELRLAAIRDNLRTIAYFIQGVGHRLQLSDETLFELELAVEEAATNIISHAYPEPPIGDMHLQANWIGNTVQITLTDWGMPLDPAKVKPFDLGAPVESRIKGGMGLHFIHELMDDVHRASGDFMGDANKLTLVKNIKRGSSQRQARRMSQEISAIQTVSEGIAAGIDLDDLLNLIVNKLVDTIDADRGTLYLVDDETDEVWSKILQEDTAILPEIRINIGEGIAGHVAATGEILNIAEAQGHPLFNPNIDEITGYRTRTILAVPMRNPQQKIIGVVQLLNRRGGPFLRRDERLLSAMAAQAAISIENARLYAQELEQQLINRELETARSIQLSFLPEEVPDAEGWDIGVFWAPIHNVAGDFYDFYWLADGRLAFIIADVSGKGIPAALFMALSVTVLRFGMQLSLSPAELLDRANNLILENQRSRMFATIFVGYLDTETGEMQFASAGHNPPIRYCAADNICIDVVASGVAVGVFSSATFDESMVTLESEDVLIIYTDGITEIINPHEEDYGEDRLRRFIMDNRHMPAQELTEAVIDDINAFSEEEGSFDDETLIIIKRLKKTV